MLEITNLDKTYANGFKALNNVNLSIKKGEVFALLGPNGAGKTTLISAVCSLVQPTSGTIVVDGHDVYKEFRKARAKIGLVPQEIMVDIFSNPLDEMAYARGYAGLPANPELIEEILKDLSLWDKRNNQLQALSGGMKRRFLIARALATEPKVLFLDEPTAGVDVELRRGMIENIKKLRERGVTIILTTHYIEEAEELADRVAVIDKGEIKLVEEKDKLMQRMGQKTLKITLSEKLDSIPTSIKSKNVDLSTDGYTLSYVYKTGEQTGITTLLHEIREAGLSLEDIDSEKSSLEEIFVQLVNDPNKK